MLLAKVNYPYDISNIVIKDKEETGSLYDVIMKYAKDKSLILYNNNLAYIDEIRADYVNHELYIPVFTYDIINEGGVDYQYNSRLSKLVIHTYKDGYVTDEIIVIPFIGSNEAYRIKLNNLELCRKLNDEDKSAENLFKRYIRVSYGYCDIDNDTFDYIPVQKKDLKTKHRKVLKEHNLDFYGEFLDMDYRDVRNWKLEKLTEIYTEEELGTSIEYNIKRLEFELELYTRIYNQEYWDNWTKGTIDSILCGTREFIKYKQRGIYLIFKGKWLASR